MYESLLQTLWKRREISNFAKKEWNFPLTATEVFRKGGPARSIGFFKFIRQGNRALIIPYLPFVLQVVIGMNALQAPQKKKARKKLAR